MKTSEFIKRIEALGYEVKEGVGYEIYHAGNIVSRVFKMHESVVDTSHSEFRYLNNRDRMDLLDLIIEYARTPIDEREEEKKYYIKPKGMKLNDDTVIFGFSIFGSYWHFSYKEEDRREVKNTFTLKELEDLGIDVEHYDLEEVE